MAEEAFGFNENFETPTPMLPPAPVSISNTATTITGNASYGDEITGEIKRGEETFQLPVTMTDINGGFTIDLSTLNEPFTIQVGDIISLVAIDVVKNRSIATGFAVI